MRAATLSNTSPADPAEARLFAFVGSCLTSLFVATGLIAWWPNEYQTLAFVWAASWGLAVYPVFRSRPFDWFEPPVFQFSIGFIHTYRVIYLVIYQDFRNDFLPSLEKDASIALGIQAISLSLLISLCYLLGYYSQRSKKLSYRLPNLPGDWSLYRLHIVMILGSAIGLTCFFIVTSIAGGPLEYFYDLNYWRRQVALQGLVSFRRGMALMPFVAILWYAYYLTQGSPRSVLPWRIPYYYWAFLLISFIVGISIGSRSSVIYPFYALLAAYHYLRKRLTLSKLVLAAIGILLFVVIMQAYRQVTGELEGVGSDDLSERTQVITERSYNPLQVLNEAVRDRRGFDETMYRLYVLRIPEDLLWGKTYLYYLIWPIPRSLWPGKIEIGFATKPQLIKGAPPGFMGELYHNFYIPGVVIGFFLWGTFHRMLYTWMQNHSGNKSITVLYIITLVLLADPDRLAVLSWLPVFLSFRIILRFLTRKSTHTFKQRHIEGRRLDSA